MKTLKKAVSVILLGCMLMALGAAGAYADGAANNALTLAIVDTGTQTKQLAKKLAANEDYQLEVLNFATSDELLAALKDGEKIDLVLVRSKPLPRAELAEYCVELTGYLNDEDMLGDLGLIPNLTGVSNGRECYAVPLDFQIYTWYGNGELPAPISFAEAEKAAGGMDNILQTSAWGREELLSWTAHFFTGAYIDFAAGESKLAGSGFENVLEIAQSLPEKAPTESRNEDVLLNFIQLDSKFSMIATAKLYGGKDYKFIGIPNEAYNGGFLSVCSEVGITKTCANPNAACEIIEDLFDEFYELPNNQTHLPAVEDEFEDALEACIGYTYIDKADAEKILKLVADSTAIEVNDGMIDWIIDKNAADFFSGAVSAAEAVQAMDSEIEAYINEK